MNATLRDPKYWIEKLCLEPHPEGGYFRQTYKSDFTIAHSALPGFRGARAASTAIYFLLAGENFSAFHRLRSDEMWHFYAGSSLEVHVIDEAGDYFSILLGSDPEQKQVFQALVKAGCWFASEVQDHKSWALVGCTVAPGFEFEDFELARREELAQQFPHYRELVVKLTRA
ncbi:MAG TPA: cupin domain-containing protein [Verrucomicrobiae bacterium]|nr:cupin domain-containing protein [Verrucomicrobiae bacterium]